MNLYNLNQISIELGISYRQAQNKIKDAGIKNVHTENQIKLYSELQLNHLKRTSRPKEVVYEIYESKMNYLKHL